MAGPVDGAAPPHERPLSIPWTLADAEAPDVRRVDVGRWRRQEMFLGALLPTALGICGVVAAAIGATDPPDSTGVRIVTGIVGLLFLLLGLALFAWVLFGPPQAVLEISADRLALRGRAGLLWELPWPAVAGLHLVRAGSEVQTWKARSGLGIRVTWARHYLVVNLREGTKRPAGLHGTRGRQGVVNLGVLPGTARAVAAVLGARLGDPQPEHLDAQHSAATRRAGN